GDKAMAKAKRDGEAKFLCDISHDTLKFPSKRVINGLLNLYGVDWQVNDEQSSGNRNWYLRFQANMPNA
ncbi:hypothetical protein KW791_03865, partial [Candidatus Parcubacteria bacterium]|nr:hypothetical protein [Candidatus Parcubacteria bacterium]